MSERPVMLIPRTAPEWFLSIFVVIAGIAIALTGDQRLGAYILWLPAVTVEILIASWAAVLVGIGIARVLTLVGCVCSTRDLDGVCVTCPLFDRCRIRSVRRSLALVDALLLAVLCISLTSGDSFLLAAGFVGLAATFDYLIWAILLPRRRGLKWAMTWTPFSR